MTRPLFALALLAAFAATLSAAPVPVVPPDATKDHDGNPLPKGATARLGSRPFHGKGLSGLAFSADGKKLLAIPDPEQVCAWDAAGRTLPAMPIRWGDAADGEHVVASTLAGSRAIWITQPADRNNPDRIDPKAALTAYAFDLADGREVARARFSGHVNFDALPHRIWTAAVSADGKYLAVAPEQAKTVEVFNMTTGKRLHTQKLAGAGDPGVYISPDSKTLYVTEYKKPLRRFELVSGKELPEVANTDDEIDLLAASPDGKRLAVRVWVGRKNEGGKEVGDAVLTLHDTATNKALGKLELDATPLDFGFVGSGSVIVLAAKYRPEFPPLYTLSRWNATTLKREWEVPGPDLMYKFSLRVIVAPDGKRFAFTDYLNFVHVYDAATGKWVTEPSGHGTWVSWVGFSPDGERVTTVGRDGVRTWTLTGERKSAVSLPELTRGRIHPTLFGEHLVWVAPVVEGKSAELVGWDRAKGKIGWRMPVEGEGPQRVLTPDGNRCVGVSWNAAKRAWDVTAYDGPKGLQLGPWTYNAVKNRGPLWWQPMALSADGKTLFIGNEGIVGFDAATGKEMLRIDAGKFEPDHTPAAFPMAVSGDGKRIAVIRGEPRRGKVLRVFEIETGKELATHALGNLYKPALRFSPSGKQVAVWNVWGPTVQVCNAESSKTEPRKLEGGNSRAWCAAFSPNGMRLAVGYEDGTALIWDVSAK